MDRALLLATASRQLKLARAECLAFLGRHAEAQESANDLLRADTMCADAIYVRGLCLYYEDQLDKAFNHFQQVLKFAPDHQKAKDIYKVRRCSFCNNTQSTVFEAPYSYLAMAELR